MYLLSAPEGVEYLGLVEPNAEVFSEYTTNVHIDPDVSNVNGEWVCSAYEPIYDSYGNVVAYAGADASMDLLTSDIWNFIFRMALIFSGFIIHI